MYSPDNFRVTPINSKYILINNDIEIISSDKKGYYFDKNNNLNIQGKKIDFTQDIVDINDENKNNIKSNVNATQNSMNKNPSNYKQNYGNKYYNNVNNINNNLINQNNINIINNNYDYPKINISPPHQVYMNNNIQQMSNKKPKIKCTCSKTGCKKKYCACYSSGINCDGCECKDCENKPESGSNKVDNNQSKDGKLNYLKEELISPKKQRIICNCTKSNCMKKYCECYKQGMNCNGLCRCLECKNKNYNSNINYQNNNYINCSPPNSNYNNQILINSNNNEGNNPNTNNFYSFALNNNYNTYSNSLPQIQDNYGNCFPETFGKSIDYSNPANFQSEAFAVYIKKEKLRIEPRKVNLNIIKINTKNIVINNYKCTNNVNKEKKEGGEQNNIPEINETPKFTNKKRLRNTSGNNTCATTNSSNRRKKGVSLSNKEIKKKKLQLN